MVGQPIAVCDLGTLHPGKYDTSVVYSSYGPPYSTTYVYYIITYSTVIVQQ